MPRKPKPPTRGGARPGAGRPRLPESEKRVVHAVSCRFSAEQYARLELDAAALGMTVTALVTQRALA